MHSPFTTCYVRRIMSTENSSERSWSTQYEFTERCVRVLWEFFDLAYREIQKIWFFYTTFTSYFVRRFHQAHPQTPKSERNVLMSRTPMWKWFKATRASAQMNAKRDANLENPTYTIELMEWHANKRAFMYWIPSLVFWEPTNCARTEIELRSLSVLLERRPQPTTHLPAPPLVLLSDLLYACCNKSADAEWKCHILNSRESPKSIQLRKSEISGTGACVILC